MLELVYFSPTGSSANILRLIAGRMELPYSETDLTDYKSRNLKRSFGSDTFALIGAPVYGGRIPTPMAERLHNMSADGAGCAVIAVYGNRDYEDALLELAETARGRGFLPIAAAAFIAEHSIVHSVGAGRPDFNDLGVIKDFAAALKSKMKFTYDNPGLRELGIKGNSVYREYGGIPLKPTADRLCTNCGICAQECPVGAIPADAPSKTDSARCISCMRCIKVCPKGARSLNKLKLFMASKVLEAKCSSRRDPEVFI